MLLREFFDIYLSEREERRGHVGNALSLAKSWLRDPRVGGTEITALTLPGILKWKHERARDVATSTVRAEIILLNAVLRCAASEHHGIRPGVLALLLPPGREPQDRSLSETDARRLLAASAMVSRKLQLFMEVAFLTGARKSAIELLRRDQIDILGGEWALLNFRRGAAQTAKRRAAVPVPARLAFELLALGDDPVHVFGPGGWSCRRHFARAVALAGLPRHTTPHAVKHTVASLLFASGEDVGGVSQMTATTVKTLMRVYISHSPSRLPPLVRSLRDQLRIGK